LAVHCTRTAALRGAKSIKLADIEHAIHSNPVLSAFLAEDFPRRNSSSDDYVGGKGAGAKGKKSSASTEANKSLTSTAAVQLKAAAEGSGKMTSFFTSNPKVPPNNSGTP